MIDQIAFTSSTDQIDEGSRLNVTAHFRNGAGRIAETPTTVEWSLRDPDSEREVLPFTSVTPGTAVVLATTATQNMCCRLKERREITVLIDRGLASQFTSTYVYNVRNIGAISQ